MKHHQVDQTFLNGPLPASFCLFSSFQQLTVNMLNFKICQRLDSNHRHMYPKWPLCQPSYNHRPLVETSTSQWSKLFHYGSGCDSVGRAVASNSRGLQFKSRHWQKFILNILLSTVLKIQKRGREWPIFKTFSFQYWVNSFKLFSQ